jgi:5-methylcytosine-specific restriction endonuclease McrA
VLQTKVCTKCNEIKAVTEFSGDKTKKDGLCSSCKVCESERKRKRRASGGDFTPKQKKELLEIYKNKCQWCGSKEHLQAEHRLPQIICNPKTASILNNGWILCRSCNIAKSDRLIIEAIPKEKDSLAGLLQGEYLEALKQGRYDSLPTTINGKPLTEVKFM